MNFKSHTFIGWGHSGKIMFKNNNIIRMNKIGGLYWKGKLSKVFLISND